MILACKNISMAYGDVQVLSNIAFHIEENEKVAIVGANGAGKTTLFKIITGSLKPTDGQVITSTNLSIGYLAQNQTISSDTTIYEEILKTKQHIIDLETKIHDLEFKMKTLKGDELEQTLKTYANFTHTFEIENGYAYKSEVIGILKGLGFTEEDFTKKVTLLSGGQKTRLYLAKLLITKPNLLLLDEPTNHLDMNSIAWLETFLINYKGAILIVSHDRYFMDKVVTKIIDIDATKAHVYNGSYSEFVIKKEDVINVQLKQFMNQQKEISRQEEIIKQLRAFNREKSIKRAESREKMLDKVEKLDKPIVHQDQIHFSLEPKHISGNDVLSIKEISKSFDKLHLFSDASFEIKRSEKVALIGNNGTGKTTILKMLINQLAPDSGEIKLGAKVKVGYYDQEHQVLDMNKSLFDEVSDAYPNLSQTEIRNVLAAFLFTNDDVFKLIGSLSGGERGRVSLAKLMLSEANFLLLDEPTNHLDIASKEILESALARYTGTVLFISHDRYFINKTANRILELTPSGMISYDGNYDYYLEKKIAPAVNNDNNESIEISYVKEDWLKKKEDQSKERKKQTEISNIEKRISTIESRCSEIDNLLCMEEVYTNHTESLRLHEEKSVLDNELITLYEKWDQLND
ncbi:MAG: transporter related [Clostridiales bacterium]|jgi:ATP-binding cassette subfamily F protein 3|nr:transporter related [Clostridiales bacterium]